MVTSIPENNPSSGFGLSQPNPAQSDNGIANLGPHIGAHLNNRAANQATIEAAEKKTPEKGKMKRNLINLAIGTATTALFIIGLFAACFAAATLITGFAWLPFTISLVVAGAAFAGGAAALYFGVIRRGQQAKAEDKEENDEKEARKA